MVRLGTLLRRTPRDKDKPEEPPAPRAFLGPPLMVLIPDVAGVSSFRLYSFSNAEAATRFVLSLSRQQRERAHAFWALQDEPTGVIEGEDTAGEATVLIRAAEGSDLVYVVSFVDIESAQSFARFEVKRGMHLGLMLVYWASMVNVVQTEDRIQLVPDFPPRVDSRRRRSQARRPETPELRPPAEPQPAAASPPAEQKNGRQALPSQPDMDAEAETEELRRVAAEAESHRRIAAEAAELRDLLAEEQEKQRIAARAEEQRRFEAEVAERQRVEAETAEQRRLAAEAEEQRRLVAEAEEQRRLAVEAEEQRRLAVEAEEQRRLAAEAEEHRRLAAEAEEQRRLEASAAEERRLEAAAEEQRRTTAQAKEGRRQAEAEEKQRQESEERASLEAAAEDRQRAAAQAQAERDRAAAAEMQRLREAVEQEQRRVEAEAQSQHAGDPALDHSFDRQTEEVLAGTQAFQQSDEIADGRSQSSVEVPNPIEELLQQEAQTRVQIPAEFAKEPPDGTEGLPDEDDAGIADEVGKILRRRRWEKRDAPFQGFNSPPGRF